MLRILKNKFWIFQNSISNINSRINILKHEISVKLLEIADLDRDNERIYKELSDAQENYKLVLN